ncbi:MAG: hypothetical protein R8G66_28090 [Cytophagales bacterium]|nr:hypothetical protein [Cytophagales bacterium]
MIRISTYLTAFLLTGIVIAQDFSIFQYRSVGPLRGGRVTAVGGTVAEPGTFYQGATGGGVWKTTDYGLSWKNVSDGFFATPSIGDIAVDQKDPNIVYVGTGSDGLRSNVITGKGMYKSVDAGESWEFIGLKNTGHIGAVEIHPSDNNTVFVAAIGNAFAPNPERGVFRTKDGGKTWEKVLFISDRVGFSDIEFLPGNPNVIFATAWKAERKPWTIISGGTQQEGGIYKSLDGGDTWEKITKGLPEGLVGKIDLGVSAADSKILYALVEAPGEEGGMYKSENQGKSFKQVSNDRGIRTRPFYYTNVEVDPKNPDVLYVMATGYFKSTDGGKEWKRMRPPHGDNHDMWINPENPDLFIQANDGGANVTFNGGETWTTQFNQPTAELYQVEVDDQYPYWLYGGQQDNSTTVAVPSRAPGAIQAPETGWIINTGGCETGPAVPKPGNHNIVYANCKGRFDVFDKRTGTERNYDVGAANMYGQNPNELKYRFQRVSPIHVSPHNPDVVYHTSQFVHKTTDDGKTWETISPDLTAFDPDKQVISGSPITRDITGEEFYSTIYAIRESPVQEGVIWVGANDGPVHVTRDGGDNWQKVTPKRLPEGGRVDAVEPSPHRAEKAYIAVLRYQLGDWKPYIWKTADYGKSWTLLTNGTNGIPADYPTRVVREDPDREGVLYAGTEFGMFISMDDGANWKPFQQNLPVTPITDIKVFRKDLAISTMGRGFYVLDNLSSLHDSNYETVAASAYLFKPRDTYRYKFPKMRTGAYPRPAVNLDYYLPDSLTTPLRLDIINEANEVIKTIVSGKSLDKEEVENMRLSEVIYVSEEKLATGAGFHRFNWDMTNAGPWHNNANRRYRSGPRAKPGNYKVKLTVGDTELEQSFILSADPRSAEAGISESDIAAHESFALQIAALLGDARRASQEVSKRMKSNDLDGDKKARLKEIKEILETAKGTYMKPKLIDQISYLYGTVSGSADFMPGKDAYDRYKELLNQYNDVKDALDD